MSSELPEIGQLRLRLAAVERRTTRLRWIGVAIAVTGVAGAVAGAAVVRHGFLAGQGSLEARRVVLRDESGAMRAVLGMRNDGSVALVLADGEARPRAMLGVARDGVPALGLSDRQG